MNEFPTYVVLDGKTIDAHLAAASGVYVKVLLAALRRQDTDPGPIAAWLNLPESDVREAIGYWEGCGVLPSVRTASSPAASPADREATSSAPAKPLPDKPRLTARQLAQRVEQSEQLQFVLQTSEGIYGRPLTDTERRGLVYFYEELGLPADVIVMAVDFCVSNGKLQFNYLQKLCRGWAEQGVTTHALAEEYIQRQTQRWSNEKLVMDAFGIRSRGLTTDERKFIGQWFQLGYGIDMIRLAYERSVDKIGRLSFPYINKILVSWHEKDIRTPEEAAERDQPARAPEKAAPRRSYDAGQFDALGLELPDPSGGFSGR